MASPDSQQLATSADAPTPRPTPPPLKPVPLSVFVPENQGRRNRRDKRA